MPQSGGSDEDDGEPRALQWRSWPIVDDFPRSLVLLAALAGSAAAVGVAFGGLGYALLAAALLSISLGRYLLPTAFELDQSGAAARFAGQRRRMAWGEAKRVSVQRRGVYLSPFERPSRLESFRGLFLRFAGNANEVVRFVERQTAMASEAS